jgi:hypothetical protein
MSISGIGVQASKVGLHGYGLARLIHGMAGIRWRVSPKALIAFTELGVKAIRST